MRHLVRMVSAKLMLVALFSFAAIIAKGQSSLVVSKGVQQVANKKAFDAEKQNKKYTTVASVATPQITVSKGVQNIGNTSETQGKGNMVSEFPYWAVSKGVVQHHHDDVKPVDYYTKK